MAADLKGDDMMAQGSVEGATQDRSKLYGLLEAIGGADAFQRAQGILETMLADYGLAHFAYGAVNLPARGRERPLVMTTYSAEWQNHYLQHGYMDIDPAVRTGLQRLLPFDWAEADHEEPVLKRFFGEAEEFKVGCNGLSIPIRGRHGEFALFTATALLRGREWEKLKQALSNDLFVIGYYFHDWALKLEGIDKNDYRSRLTIREKDCLEWKAIGKSDWDISRSLSISQRTVEFHLDNARRKLGAANTTHTVTKALNFGLIAPL